MSDFDEYRNLYKTIKLTRSTTGVLEITLHHEGGPWRWDARAGHDLPHRELSDALLKISRDRENRVIILTGTGDEFSGPKAHAGTASRGDARHWEALHTHGAHMIMDLLNLPAPVISCINGPAYRHAEIPLLADIVLVAEHAFIQDSAHFPNRMVPGDGIALFLPFLMGWNRGRYFHLTGQVLTASDMLAYGLANEVLPGPELLPRARELAEQLAQNNPLVLRHTRTLLTAPLKALARQYLDLGFALESLAAVDEAAHLPTASA